MKPVVSDIQLLGLEPKEAGTVWLAMGFLKRHNIACCTQHIPHSESKGLLEQEALCPV